jgi:hypothetical protein
LPITDGNILETFITGGVLPEPPAGPMPQAKIKMSKQLEEEG